MTFVVAFAFIAAVGCIAWKSYREAFLYVYLPILICVPAWPRWILSGFPDPTFQQAAILPIAVAFFWRGHHRVSILDYYIFSFLGLAGVSELLNAGYPAAQNLVFDTFGSGLLPYLVAKGIMSDERSRIRFIQVFVLCTSAVIVTTLFELKFAYNPFRILFDPFFPGQGEGWVTTFRYGLPRVAGPYGHAILAGIMFMIALRFQCWLQSSGNWTPRLAKLSFGLLKSSTVSKFLTVWNFMGLCLTWVRGPQIGALLAWIVVRIGRSSRPKVRLRQAVIAIGLAAIPLSVWFLSWIAGGRAAAVTAGQESAAYRKELLEKYGLVVLHHAWFGWGRNGWPKVPGMPSIDNYFLLVGLMHGIPAIIFFVMIFVVVFVKLGKIGIRLASKNPAVSSLSFTLLSIYVGLAFSLSTVYLGEAVFAVLFSLLGFTEAFLMQKERASSSARVAVARPAPTTARFRRVVA